MSIIVMGFACIDERGVNFDAQGPVNFVGVRHIGHGG